MPESDTLIGWLSGLIPSVASQIGDLIPGSSSLADSVSHPAITTSATPNVSPSTSPSHALVSTPTATAIGSPPAPPSSASPPTTAAIASSHPSSLTETAILTSQPPVVVSSTPTPQSTSVSSRPDSGVVVGIVLGACTAAICLALASRSYVKRRQMTAAPVTTLDPFMDPDSYIDGGRRGRTVEQVRAQIDSLPVATAQSLPSVAYPRWESANGASIICQRTPSDARKASYMPVAMPGGGLANEHMGTAVDVLAFVCHEVEHRGSPRHDTDGGVRLAGGRPGEAVEDDFDQHSASDGSTLPPPYSSHFGERRDAEGIPQLTSPRRAGSAMNVGKVSKGRPAMTSQV